jgi:hypothetical protein
MSALALGVFAALPFSATGEGVIHSLASTLGSQKVESVPLLRSDGKIESRQEADGLHLQLRAQAPGKYAYVSAFWQRRALELNPQARWE